MRSELSQLDHRLTEKIQHWPKWLHWPMVVASFMGLPVVTGLITTFFLVVSYTQGNDRVSLALLLSFAALGVSVFLKLVLRRERPETLYAANMLFKSYSFPSGHSFGSIVLYGLLAYLAHVYFADPVALIIAICLGILIFLIGLSRVYLGAHYVFDVLGGWLLGGLMLISLVNVVRS